MVIWNDTGTPMSATALFAIARTSIDRGMDKKRCGTYIQWNITQPEKEWNDSIYSNIDGPRDYHTKRMKSDRNWQMYDITYKWNLKKKIQINLFTKQKQTYKLKK